MKYLVQVRDDVEAGDEKMKELEQEMKEWGIFDSDFCLGDIFDEEEPDQGDVNQQKAKKKLSEFPVLEGEESIVEYVGQYKKACLSKKALLKSTRERLEKDQSKGHERLHFVSEVLISPILITLFWCPQMKKIMHAFFSGKQFPSKERPEELRRKWKPLGKISPSQVHVLLHFFAHLCFLPAGSGRLSSLYQELGSIEVSPIGRENLEMHR